MKLGRVAVGTVLVTIAFSGCGGSSTSSGRTTTKATTASTGTGLAAVTLPPGTPAALRGAHGGVLLAGDLPGFVPQGYQAPSTDAHSWVAEFPPEQRAAEEARLKALGFIAGLSERLAPAKGGGGNHEAVSLVELYRSSRGANGEVASQLKQALKRGETTFAVRGIPGARSFGSGTSTTDANVAFAVGSYYYLVGFSAPSGSAPTRAQLITAAQRLYRRVRG
jgi:hypothetical protein